MRFCQFLISRHPHKVCSTRHESLSTRRQRRSRPKKRRSNRRAMIAPSQVASRHLTPAKYSAKAFFTGVRFKASGLVIKTVIGSSPKSMSLYSTHRPGSMADHGSSRTRRKNPINIRLVPVLLLFSGDDRRLLTPAPFTQLQQAPGSMDQRGEYVLNNPAAAVPQITLYIQAQRRSFGPRA